MKVYEYDKHSGVYLGVVDVPEGITIPNSLTTEPPREGCFYSAGEWHDPVVVKIDKSARKAKQIRDARAAKKDEIKQRMERELVQGFMCSNGIVMDATVQDITKLRSFGYDTAVANKQLTLDIRDSANQTHKAVLLVDVARMLGELRANYLAVWDAKNKSLALLDKATTTDKINAL